MYMLNNRTTFRCVFSLVLLLIVSATIFDAVHIYGQVVTLAASAQNTFVQIGDDCTSLNQSEYQSLAAQNASQSNC